MTLRLALRRLLPLLAVLSLALTPVAAPASTAGMRAASAQATTVDRDHALAVNDVAPSAVTMADGAMDDIPCCPKPEALQPDCRKGCPFAGLCLATMVLLPPAAVPVPAPSSMLVGIEWPAQAGFASAYGPPLPEPPRA